MARIRTIKPEFWTHEDLSALPEATHMLAAALLNHADDEGYFNANHGLVKAACCPLRDPSVSVQDSLNLLVSVGYIRLGIAADGKRYGHVVTFDEHQRVNRPTPSKIKPLRIVWEGSCSPHAQLTEDSSPERNREGKGKEGEKLSSSGDDPKAHALEARVSEITRDAIETYNESALVAGGLAAVRGAVGFDKRKAQVRRMLRTARDICQEQLGAPTVTRQFWVGLWREYAKDDHFAGRLPGGRGHENWRPDFEYLTQEKSVLRLYDRSAAAAEATA